MARNLNVVVVVLLAVATLLHGSAAHTRHVVGDSTGWTIPSGDVATYATWAATKTFTIDDTLVFNFANGQHNVAKVTKSAFDACNGRSTFFTLTDSPASVALNETGGQYFICTVGDHCSFGQKLAISVTQKVSSSTTYPKAPSTGSVTHTVGDTTGWTIPNGGAAAYVTWASSKTFKVGDVLEFNYQMSEHNVEEVTKENFDSCNSVSPLATYRSPPVRVTLDKPGPHYYICGVPGHCSAGQKLAIDVTGTGTGTATTTPPSSTATSPSFSITPSPPSPADAGEGVVSPPPPQNSGAASLGLLSATVLSIAAAFFY